MSSREHAETFANILDIDPDMAYELFFSWQEKYTVDNLPALREKYRQEFASYDDPEMGWQTEFTRQEFNEFLMNTAGYRWWQELEEAARVHQT